MVTVENLLLVMAMMQDLKKKDLTVDMQSINPVISPNSKVVVIGYSLIVSNEESSWELFIPTEKTVYPDTIGEKFMGLSNNYMDMDEASAYLKIEKGTLYQWVSKGIVPYYKPTKGKTIFMRSELDEWIAKSKVEVGNGVE